MLITHEREKLIQAINFFVRNTKKCGKVKLFKLLYFLDFEHFKQTGRSVTGLNYFAWPMGPVPESLFNELDQPQPDLAKAFRIGDRSVRQGKQSMLALEPQVQFSGELFSKREMRLMETLAKEYRHSVGDDMIEATHLENSPWDKVFNLQGRPQAIIPYELAVRQDELGMVMRVAEDRKELLEKLG